MPGHAKVSTPKMIAARPRKSSIHQFFAKACTMTAPRPIPGGRPTCIVLMTEPLSKGRQYCLQVDVLAATRLDFARSRPTDAVGVPEEKLVRCQRVIRPSTPQPRQSPSRSRPTYRRPSEMSEITL